MCEHSSKDSNLTRAVVRCFEGTDVWKRNHWGIGSLELTATWYKVTPCWRASNVLGIQNKATLTNHAWRLFVLDVPEQGLTFSKVLFCTVWPSLPAKSPFHTKTSPQIVLLHTKKTLMPTWHQLIVKLFADQCHFILINKRFYWYIFGVNMNLNHHTNRCWYL